MQFTVNSNKGPAPFNLSNIPSPFNPTLSGNTFPTLPNATNQRILTLFESMGDNGANLALLDGQAYSSLPTENPNVGTTEDWVIVNPTMNAHPIHSHLVQFQLVRRQTIDANGYSDDWIAINGIPPLNHTTRNLPSLVPYLIGSTNSASGERTRLERHDNSIPRRSNDNPNTFRSARPGHHSRLTQQQDQDMFGIATYSNTKTTR